MKVKSERATGKLCREPHAPFAHERKQAAKSGQDLISDRGGLFSRLTVIVVFLGERKGKDICKQNSKMLARTPIWLRLKT